MTEPTLPPLPEPYDYCYEWDGPYGTRKFSTARHNGRQCDASVALYSKEQLRAYGLSCYEAGRTEASRPEAASKIDRVATGWAAPKDRYTTPVLFNPYSGEPRDARDVLSDPQGILLVPPGALMLAAHSSMACEAARERADDAPSEAAMRKALEQIEGEDTPALDEINDEDTFEGQYKVGLKHAIRMLASIARAALAHPPKAICPFGDKSCPCVDGDPCHYTGENAWPAPEAPSKQSQEGDA